MARPVNESFSNITGTLGRGSATIDGITFYSDDPEAVISVTPDHLLNFAFSTSGPHLFGYKSADGSNFSPYDYANPSLYSFAVYTAGSYSLQAPRHRTATFMSTT